MILITGASGNVGKEVLSQVFATGAKVRGGFQSATRAAGAPPGVEIATIDFNRPDTIRTATEGVDRVFLVGPPAPELTELERKATDAMKGSGVRHIVKLSAIGGHAAIFPRQHAESEDYIRSSGIPYTFLRPSGFMQNAVNYDATTINSQNAFYGSYGDGRVSQIDIRDIAAVAAAVLTEEGHEGKVYTLTGPKAISAAEVARILSESLGREIRYVDLPPEQFKQALTGAGVPEWSANALVDLHRFYREGGASEVSVDVEQILRRKAITFEQFARDYGQTFQVQQHAAG
jgi:uncharacterized protein YbjT (DUF2867 family)